MEDIFLRENFKIEIIQDKDSESPREWDNLGKMICFHSRYNLGDKHDYKHEDYSSWKELENDVCNKKDLAISFPLYLYDHSGITISTTPFSCHWDSGKVGFIYITKERVRKEYNCKRITSKILEKVSKCLLYEVEIYDKYIQGDVYGYIITNTLNNEEIDCLWGIFGKEETLEAAEENIEFYLNKK